MKANQFTHENRLIWALTHPDLTSDDNPFCCVVAGCANLASPTSDYLCWGHQNKRRRLLDGETVRAEARARYWADPEKAAATAAAYRETHREELRAWQKIYRDNNADHINELQREYYANNREALIAAKHVYNDEHRDHINARQRKNNRDKYGVIDPTCANCGKTFIGRSTMHLCADCRITHDYCGRCKLVKLIAEMSYKGRCKACDRTCIDPVCPGCGNTFAKTGNQRLCKPCKLIVGYCSSCNQVKTLIEMNNRGENRAPTECKVCHQARPR